MAAGAVLEHTLINLMGPLGPFVYLVGVLSAAYGCFPGEGVPPKYPESEPTCEQYDEGWASFAQGAMVVYMLGGPPTQ